MVVLFQLLLGPASVYGKRSTGYLEERDLTGQLTSYVCRGLQGKPQKWCCRIDKQLKIPDKVFDIFASNF